LCLSWGNSLSVTAAACSSVPQFQYGEQTFELLVSALGLEPRTY
jgi:hypothetical protein